MKRINFKNESFRFRLSLRDAQGAELGIADVEGIEAKFYGEFEKKVWLQYAWPFKEGFEEVERHDDDYFALEITPEQAQTAPTGTIIVQVTYKVTDDDFTQGFKQITEKGKVLILKDVL